MTDLSIREPDHADVSNLRLLADGMPWTPQQRLHTLIDAYEARAESTATLTEALEELHDDLTGELDPLTRAGKDVAEPAKAKIERYEKAIKGWADRILALRPDDL